MTDLQAKQMWIESQVAPTPTSGEPCNCAFCQAARPASSKHIMGLWLELIAVAALGLDGIAGIVLKDIWLQGYLVIAVVWITWISWRSL